MLKTKLNICIATAIIMADNMLLMVGPPLILINIVFLVWLWISLPEDKQ